MPDDDAWQRSIYLAPGSTQARVSELASRFDVLSRGQIQASIRSESLAQDGLLAFYRQTLAEPVKAAG